MNDSENLERVRRLKRQAQRLRREIDGHTVTPRRLESDNLAPAHLSNIEVDWLVRILGRK